MGIQGTRTLFTETTETKNQLRISSRSLRNHKEGRTRTREEEAAVEGTGEAAAVGPTEGTKISGSSILTITVMST